MTRDEWLEAFARELQLAPPNEDEIDAVLKLAATAAHASERTAAPLAAWLAGRSGLPLNQVNALGKHVSQPR